MDYVIYQDGRKVVVDVEQSKTLDKTRLEALVKAAEDSEE